MTAAKWTPEQEAAITARGANLLVAAAAGSGKTAVLVERIIQLISDPQHPVDVDKLLVVTFTEAAAGEMRDRISKAISQKLQEKRSAHLERQLALLNMASFTTLHAFCLELLRQYYYLCGLDPAARVMDESEARLCQEQVMEELLEACYAEGRPEFTALIDSFGGEREDQGVRNLIFKLHEFARSNPEPKAWLEDTAKAFTPAEGIGLEATQWWESLQQLILFKLDLARSYLLEALNIAAKPGGPQVYGASLEADLAVIDHLAACTTWDQFVEAAREVNWGNLKPCRSADPELKELAQKNRNKAKAIIKKLSEQYLHRSSAAWLEDFRIVVPLIAELVRLTNEFSQQYQRMKRSRGLLDYSDLEHYCLAILQDTSGNNSSPSLVARELRERYSEVLVDEYQDINQVQERILTLVSRQNSRTPNLFMVGDVKQSIYRFRLTDPKLFLHKYVGYSDTSGALDRKIELAKNFRSRLEVVHGINFIFRQLMTSRLAEVDYGKKAELLYGADYPPLDPSANNAVELHLIDETCNGQAATGETEEALAQDDPGEELAAGNANNKVEEITSTKGEARVVAARIRELMQGAHLVYDREHGYRPLHYRDIVILMRATTGQGNIFLEELRLAGIPAFADLGGGYFSAVEIETMLALLRVIDNPLQDIPLAAVLRSPIVGLSPAELARIRLVKRHGDFYQAVKSAANASLGELSDKLQRFLGQLEKWRAAARGGSVAQLIAQIYRDSGYENFVAAMPGGAQRQANLKALYDRACQYERVNFRGLFRFLRLIESLQAKGSDLGEARALGENEDVVRIMSIHKSKGLEFPVVFVTGLGKQFNLQDTRGHVLLHKDLGLGPQVVDLNEKITYPSIAKLAIGHKLETEMKAEELRILYVALTRAREKLILIGSTKDLVKQAAKWNRHLQYPKWQLPGCELAAAKSYLDWLGPAIARHSSAAELHQLAGSDCPLPDGIADDPARFVVKIWHHIPDSAPQVSQEENYLTNVFKLEPVPRAGQTGMKIKEILDWAYPYRHTAGKQAKFSVTEIKRLHELWERDEMELPSRLHTLSARTDFLQETRDLSPAERGLAYHLVLQHLQLQAGLAEPEIRVQIEHLTKQGLLSEAQAAAVEPSKIARLFETAIGKKILIATEVLREVPFNLAMSASEIYPDLTGSQDKILIQGVIDCLIKDVDGYTLIDWKTDTTADMAEIERRYKPQLDLYARAVEQILKYPVSERYVYLLETGAALKV